MHAYKIKIRHYMKNMRCSNPAGTIPSTDELGEEAAKITASRGEGTPSCRTGVFSLTDR